MTGLKHLRHHRHEVVLMHVLDPAEMDFPFDQITLFRGLEGMADVLVEPRAIRRGYLAELGRYLHRFKPPAGRSDRLRAHANRSVVGGRVGSYLAGRG